MEKKNIVKYMWKKYCNTNTTNTEANKFVTVGVVWLWLEGIQLQPQVMQIIAGWTGKNETDSEEDS